MRWILILILGSALLWGCSGSIDTTELGPEDHFNYALSLYDDEDYEVCLTEFQSILLQYPGSSITDDAQFYLGMTYFNRFQYLLAAYEFSKLIRDIPASSFVPQSQHMLAESYYELSPPYQLDQTYTEKSIEEYQAFIDFFPVNPKVEDAENKIKELTEKLAEKQYYSAYIYEKMSYYRAAIKYYDSVNEQYHDTRFAPMALYRKIYLLLDRDQTTRAIQDINSYLSKYPDDSNSEELRDLQSSLLDETDG